MRALITGGGGQLSRDLVSLLGSDPEIGIAWPLPAEELMPSQRDATAPRLRDVLSELLFEYAATSA